MFRKAISIVLIACFLFQINCATTKTIPFTSYDYDKLKNEKIIFVTVKSGQKYELIDFEITDTHLIGFSIVRKHPSSRRIIEKEKFTVELEDIEFIVVENTEITVGGVIQGILIGVGVIALFVIIVCSLAALDS